MKEDLGDKILAYLEVHERSQSYVAQKLGYTPSAFSKWIDGTNPMPAKAIHGFCDLFGLSNDAYIELLRLAGHQVIAVETGKSRVKLIEQGTSLKPLIFETTERLVTIGRAPKNAVQISNQEVSWEHCQIILMQGNYYYRHLSKSNHSILRRRGEEYLLRAGGMEEILLRNQDRLTIGNITFTIEFDLVNEDMGYITTAKKNEDT